MDKEEILLQRFKGASGREQKYHKHKDSYVRDPNNEIDGMELRKFSLVIFLNDGLDVVNPYSPMDKTGSLRLFKDGGTIDGVVDIHPRVGRAVLFKSEDVLHKVNPVVGQDNYFLTIYFT